MYLFFQDRIQSSLLPAKIRLPAPFVDATMSDDKDAIPRNLSAPRDEEKMWVPALDGSSPEPALVDDAVKPQARVFSLFERITFFLTRYGIETNGCDCVFLWCFFVNLNCISLLESTQYLRTHGPIADFSKCSSYGSLPT